MSFTTEVTTRFTTWASRNVQAKEAPAGHITEAVAIAVAEVQEVFGTPGTDLTDADTDFLETDVLMIHRAFLEAVKHMKVFVPFKIDSDLQLMLDAWDKEKTGLKASRKQQEDAPVVKERDHSNVNGIFPFGRLPWRDKTFP